EPIAASEFEVKVVARGAADVHLTQPTVNAGAALDMDHVVTRREVVQRDGLATSEEGLALCLARPLNFDSGFKFLWIRAVQPPEPGGFGCPRISRGSQVPHVGVLTSERLERQLARNPRLAEGVKQANLQVDGETIPSREELQTCPWGIFQEWRQ